MEFKRPHKINGTTFADGKILGYKTGAGFFCTNCFQGRTDKIEKTITESDLKVFFFFCDDCGDKICKKNGTDE